MNNVLKSLSNKKIALMGLKHECNSFYLFFRNEVQITYYIDRSSLPFREVWDLETTQDVWFTNQNNYSLQPLLLDNIDSLDDVMVIICFGTDQDLMEIADRYLYVNGMTYGEDYIDSIFFMQSFRKMMPTDLKDKEVWIFGAGVIGKQFYEANHKECRIEGFISNFPEEKELCGRPVIRPNELKKKERPYIVVCSISEDIMANQLEELGYIAHTDFSTYRLFKMLFMGVGICQVFHLGLTLSMYSSFQSKYVYYPIFENQLIPLSYADKIRLRLWGEICDVVLYGKENINSKDTIKYEREIHRFYKGSYCLPIPQYMFFGQHIQTTTDINEFTIVPRTNNMKHFVWFRGDEIMNKLIGEGKNAEEIYQIISDEDFICKEKIQDKFRKELRKVKILDRISAVKVAPLIEKNYKQRILFLDGTHFSAWLQLELSKQIAAKIGLEELEKNEEKEILNHLGTLESVFPIYPCVAKALDIENCGLQRKWRLRIYDHIEKESVSFKEFITRYIRYVKGVSEIRDETGWTN